MLILFALPISVHSANVRLVLGMKGLTYEERLPPDGYGSEAYRKVVPSGTIPALITEHGTLFESGAIIEYIEERWPDPPLLPTDPFERAFVRIGARYHDTRIEPIVRSLFPFVGRPEKYANRFLESAELLNDRLLRLAESHLPRPYLGGSSLTLADLGYPCTLMMAETILAHANAKLEIPSSIKEWMKLLLADQQISQQVEQLRNALRHWIQKKIFDSREK